MVAAVRVHKAGGPEVLTYEDITVPPTGPGQIRVKQHAIGVNFVDIYFRIGLYPAPGGLPFVAGNEAAGEVVEVGAGVSDFRPGDRVAYVQGPGCYAQERLVPADRVVKLPDNISYEQAAGMMLKGLTVQYLVRRTFKVDKGMTVLMHAAAGGVGLILCQWANHLGANVIGTVGSKDKAEVARANGCHHTILYREEDFVARVKEITGGKLCDVVYDGIGKTTFPPRSIASGRSGCSSASAAPPARSRLLISICCSSAARCSPLVRRSTLTPPSARTCWRWPMIFSRSSAAAP